MALLGTNAAAALPCLLACVRNNSDINQCDAARTLGEVGRKRPEITIPALVFALTNATQYGAAEIADALGSFGSTAEPAVQGLMVVSKDPNPCVRTHAAAALRRISPETKEALEPLIQNLNAREELVREDAIWALERLGSNAAPAVPALINVSLQDPHRDVRAIAISCIGEIGQVNDAVIAALSENVTNRDSSGPAVHALGLFAGRSKAAFVALLQAKGVSPHKSVRESAEISLEMISHQDPAFLVECLGHPDSALRYRAIQVLHQMRKSIAEAVPPLVKALQYIDPQVRDAATNCLIRMDYAAATNAGVIVPSWYPHL